MDVNCTSTRSFIYMPEQEQQRQYRPTEPTAPWNKQAAPFEGGPLTPDVKRPSTKSILDKLKRVDHEQAKRYKQRSGQ